MKTEVLYMSAYHIQPLPRDTVVHGKRVRERVSKREGGREREGERGREGGRGRERGGG